MKRGSSFLFATWSCLSLPHVVAGLYIAEPFLQHGAPPHDPAQHRAQQGPQVQSSPNQSQSRALQSGPQVPAHDEAPSPSGPASPNQLQPLEQSQSTQSPARRRFAASRRANTGVCTFTAYQVQVCTQDSISAEVVSYLQINTLYEPDSSTAVDLRHQRPIAEYNSYHRLETSQPWDVASLDDSRTLTIAEDDEGYLQFSYGSAEWTEETRKGDGGVGWCDEEEWYEGAEGWSCPHGETVAQRKRKIHCGFPCARIERMELK